MSSKTGDGNAVADPAELAELAGTLRRALGPDSPPREGSDWRAHWPLLADIGVTAVCVPGESGGFGFDVPAAVVCSRELGASLHPGPYAGTVAATFALSRWLPQGDGAAVVGEILAGAHVPTVALLDPGARLTHAGGELHVDGCARTVIGAAGSDSFLAVDPATRGMAFVRRSDRCQVSTAHSFDVTRACADVGFHDAVGHALSSDEVDTRTTLRLHGLLLAGDALGGVHHMLERTTTYARDRVAFGKPIGGFQAVQHRLVDHAVRVRGLALMTSRAAEAMAAEPRAAGREALLAELAVSTHAVRVLHDLLQLTGAIGFTWEYGLHLYERRAHLDARSGRNPRQTVRALADVLGWG
jgi:alkylation response protein AidB-like acyl-CoA dehydrogenase